MSPIQRLFLLAPALAAACVTQYSIRQLPPTEANIRADFERLARVDAFMGQTYGLGWQKLHGSLPIIAFCTLDGKKNEYANARLEGKNLCGEYRYFDQPAGQQCVALSELQSIGAFYEVKTLGQAMYMDDIVQPWTCEDRRKG